MRARILAQPGDSVRLGDLLNEQLADAAGWTEFRAAVAFGKRSGLLRLAPSLESFLTRGTVSISIGVDMQGTSKEGLQILLDSVVSKGGTVWVFRNEHAMRPTFHPKVYLFKRSGMALLIVGSGNFTAGGLYSNYEGSIVLDLDLGEPAELRLLEDAEGMLNAWCSPRDALAQALNARLIQDLVDQGIAPTEIQTRGDEASYRERQQASSGGRRPGLFGKVRVPGPPAVTRPSAGQAPAPRRRRVLGAPQRGPVVWSKQLSATDAQHQPGHAVGGVRLTQAGFEVEGGGRIDQTTYFRYVLFNDFGWSIVRQAPNLKEQAAVPFIVTILGRAYGLVELEVSHKPSGEAGQGNYTTILHWGELAEDVRATNITGRTLTLYGPPSGQREPFFIEVS